VKKDAEPAAERTTKRPEDSVAAAIAALDSLPEYDRVEAMAWFCRACGRRQPESGPGCQCWNDE
jgi:hypothetical protein